MLLLVPLGEETGIEPATPGLAALLVAVRVFDKAPFFVLYHLSYPSQKQGTAIAKQFEIGLAYRKESPRSRRFLLWREPFLIDFAVVYPLIR